MSRFDDVVAYTFNADLYCPAHIVGALPTGPGGAFDGWALAAGADRMPTEDDLTEIAVAFGIDRDDESSFDSGDFPKVVFADMLEPGDRCGTCGELLDGSDNDESDDARLDLFLALAHFTADWHGGQWSRLYRLGCRARRRLADEYGISHPLDTPLGGAARELYAHLEANYSHERR